MEIKEKKYVSYITAAFIGILYGVLVVGLSRGLIRNLAICFRGIGKLAGLKEDLLDNVTQALLQLKEAGMASPWAASLLVAAVLGVLYRWMIRKRKRKVLISCLVWFFLLLPFTVLTAGVTKVNDVSLLSLKVWHQEQQMPPAQTYESQGEEWYLGFGRRQILPKEDNTQPLYIAGYNNGVEITDVLDYCEARAVWLDTGEEGVLLIGVDCVALDSGTVHKIREALADLPDCASINVYSTHTHAGIDTLGLWGPLGVDGKNDGYMENLISAAEEAAREAAANRTAGTLFYGKAETTNMYRDSRMPLVYDENLYQLRFEPKEGEAGTRLLFYGAHPEALRGSNTLLSRDYAGMLCDGVSLATGDNTMFLPGAIGGLIMTREFIAIRNNNNEDAVKNLTLTSELLIEDALSITPQKEQEIPGHMAISRQTCTIPMDNIGFLLFKYLGILTNQAAPADSATGYGVETEVSVLLLDDLAVTLIPGEIFPELVRGGQYGKANPEGKNPVPLQKIAEEQGIENMLIVGLANDEIGYIVPPSDFLVNEKMPYLEKIVDYTGENHYEETNSIGPECANVIAQAFEAALNSLKE